MLLVDYTKDIIQSITLLDYFNHPEKLDEAGALAALIGSLGGWGNVTAEALAAAGVEGSKAGELMKIASASTGDIWRSGGLMLAVALGSAAAQCAVGLIASYVSAGLSTNIRSAVYKKVDSFSASEVDKFSTPSLITRTTNDVQQVQIANIMMLRMVVAAPITAVWAICKIRATSMKLTWATIVAVVLTLACITAIMIVVMPKFKSMQKLTDKLNGVSRENLTGIRVVRAYNAEGYQEEKFEKANVAITKTQLFTGRVMALMSPIMTLIMNGISLALYWIGASLINKGATDFPTISSFMMLASQIIMAFMMLMMMFVLLPRAQVSAERINRVLGTEVSVKDPETDAERTETGTVEFKNVTFRYPDSDEAVIKNISFRVNKGDTVAFIGSTGSGKSTLINLVPRFFDVTEGQILIDGVDVREIKQKTLRHIIGYVPQKGVLFTGTVKENIAFGNPALSDEEIVAAAKVAEADDFVSRMEKGYESDISQGGKNVSGGQKQRLSIARAVAMKPEIFIFDDSFSALDYKTDKKVRENLREAAAGTTKLIVAQRIGTIMDADKIVVLDSGDAVGVGTHKELLETCPVYREIALSQLSKEELGL
ncbi:MAG: multidrug ABC transporter ATP-binding protein [Clostridiales bacterium]|nr:ABC transporter ATP-binding protein [Clostridia bacterium]PWM00222.1 MAG: multidrug ABC transporter ATP-binding protein [Clostridiales bacterium]